MLHFIGSPFFLFEKITITFDFYSFLIFLKILNVGRETEQTAELQSMEIMRNTYSSQNHVQFSVTFQMFRLLSLLGFQPKTEYAGTQLPKTLLFCSEFSKFIVFLSPKLCLTFDTVLKFEDITFVNYFALRVFSRKAYEELSNLCFLVIIFEC